MKVFTALNYFRKTPLFWQDSKYTSSSEHASVCSEYTKVLNMPGFWICKGYRGFWIYLNNSWICLFSIVARSIWFTFCFKLNNHVAWFFYCFIRLYVTKISNAAKLDLRFIFSKLWLLLIQNWNHSSEFFQIFSWIFLNPQNLLEHSLECRWTITGFFRKFLLIFCNISQNLLQDSLEF